VNYQKCHDALVDIGRQRGTRQRPGFELHHVIPSCMGGSDDESNKALLTYREHFVLHRILTKLHPSHSGLHCAVWRMMNDGKHEKSGRVYEKARQNFIDNHHSKTSENRVAASKRGKLAWSGDGNPAKKPKNRKSKSLQQKLAWEGDSHPSKKQKNRKAKSDQLSKQNSQAHAEGKHPMQKPENRAAKRAAWEGDKHPMKKQKNRKALSERGKEQVQCTHCFKAGGRAGMQKYHFVYCLQHPDNLGLTRKQITARRKAEKAL